MPARKAYESYFEVGSAATKREVFEPVPKQPKKSPKTKKVTDKNKQVKVKKNRASMVVFVLCAFAMTMIMTYRFSLINEKNLASQSLKKELEKTESKLITAQIGVEQSTDLNKIEAYAKQKLGMQKPDKNQTVYIDTSKTTKTVETAENSEGLQSIIESIVNAIKNIF